MNTSNTSHRQSRCRSLHVAVGRLLEIDVWTSAACDDRLRPELAPESRRIQLDRSRSDCGGFVRQREPCGREELSDVRGDDVDFCGARGRVIAGGACDGALLVVRFEPGSGQSGRISSWHRWKLLRAGPFVFL